MKLEMATNWGKFLSNANNWEHVAPVNFFPHAPLSNIWNEFAVPGLTIEIPNVFLKCGRPVYWIATVIGFSGYKAVVDYERFGHLPPYCTWISFCSRVPKHIGFADRNFIPLCPPQDIRAKYSDYIERARQTLKDCLTISENHGEIIEKQINLHQKYKLGDLVEVLDRADISRMRMAQVTALVGDRIHVSYVIQPQPNDKGFWFSSSSESVRPVGWSLAVGHPIYDPIDLDAEATEECNNPRLPEDMHILEGEILEARHPIKPHQICVATIHKVLKYGYFVAAFVTCKTERKRPTLFAFHVTSPFIFPIGFCVTNGIDLVNSLDNLSHLAPAPLHMLPKRPPHNFVTGHKMEAVDILSPICIFPVTVTKVVGHLLHLHFDGWCRDEPTSYVWTEAASPDIYPVGYAELVGFRFDGQPDEPNPSDYPAEN